MIIAGIIIGKFNKNYSENLKKSKKIFSGIFISLVASFILGAISFIIEPNGMIILIISFLLHAVIGSFAGIIIQLDLKHFKKYSGQQLSYNDAK